MCSSDLVGMQQKVADIIKLTKQEILRLQDTHTEATLGIESTGRPVEALQNVLRLTEGFDFDKGNLELLLDTLHDELAKIDDGLAIQTNDPMSGQRKSNANMFEATLGPGALESTMKLGDESFRRSPRAGGSSIGFSRKPTNTHPIVA